MFWLLMAMSTTTIGLTKQMQKKRWSSQSGFFDTHFAGGGSEDIDYSWRFFHRGLKLVYRPRAIVFHHHRVTQKGLFRQHMGYGRGQAILCRKYPEELRWNWRDEFAAWKDLGKSTWALTKFWDLAGRNGRESMELYYAYFDFLRKLGQRTGFVQGKLAWRFALGACAADRTTKAA